MKGKFLILSVFLQASIFALNLSNLNEIRIEHVKELLGKNYGRSVASVDVNHKDIKGLVSETVSKTLPKKYKYKASMITNAIIAEAIKYELDPVFLSAVIMNESSFNPSAKGTSGEIGLMQILPSTGKWMAKKIKMKWRGKRTLQNPVQNIKLGAAYINLLRNKYKHGQLYLAAYNMGPGNLRRALSKKIRPKDYTVAVMKRYFDIYKKI